MRFSRFLLPNLLLLATFAVLMAQTPRTDSPARVVRVASPLTSSVPRTLTRHLTVVQTLANGTSITQTFTIKEAYDSEGRTYSKMQHTLHVRADGQPVDLITYRIFDPVARERINWEQHTKIANVTHIPDHKTVQDQMVPMPVPENEGAGKVHIAHPTQQQTTEDLGERTIAGVEAKGTRRTGVIPAGYQGNDKPLLIVSETWTSTQYDIPLLTIIDDPRSGKRTDEVTEFQPGEPDPALFRVPEGYTVHKH